MSTWDHTVALRTDLIEQLAAVPAARWDEPTLCTEWRVRDVVAHLVLPERLSVLTLAGALVRSGFSIQRFVRDDAIRRGSVPVPELIAAYRAGIDRRTVPPGRNGEHLLADLFVHTQDIRRPLGLPWHHDPDLLTLVAGVVQVDSGLGVTRRVEGLRLRATDTDWCAGAGAEITGTTEALILAMHGRTVVLPELAGPGGGERRARLSTD